MQKREGDLRQDADQQSEFDPQLLEDVRVAEEQFARGEAIPHDEAKRRILERFKPGG
jgi:hypothetical protein